MRVGEGGQERGGGRYRPRSGSRSRGPRASTVAGESSSVDQDDRLRHSCSFLHTRRAVSHHRIDVRRWLRPQDGSCGETTPRTEARCGRHRASRPSCGASEVEQTRDEELQVQPRARRPRRRRARRCRSSPASRARRSPTGRPRTPRPRSRCRARATPHGVSRCERAPTRGRADELVERATELRDGDEVANALHRHVANSTANTAHTTIRPARTPGAAGGRRRRGHPKLPASSGTATGRGRPRRAASRAGACGCVDRVQPRARR